MKRILALVLALAALLAGCGKADDFALLREHGDFNRADAVDVTFTYDYDDPRLEALRTSYGLAEIAGEGDTQDRAVRLLSWLCEHTRHSNDFDISEYHSLYLLGYAYDTGNGLNCRFLSVILSEMYLSVGIQARVLWLMPHSEKDTECHAVVMAWSPELGKWMFLDPTNNAWFADAQGGALSPMEIRGSLARGTAMAPNPDARPGYDGYRGYLAKDMFYFESIVDTYYGAFDSDYKTASLCPIDFDVAACESRRYGGACQLSDYTFAAPASFWGE